MALLNDVHMNADERAALQMSHISESSETGEEKNAIAVNSYSWLARFKTNTWVLPLLYSYFWIIAAYSLLQPFFPVLSSSKCLSAWKYGFVFSTYEIFMLLGCVFTERLVKLGSPRSCYFFSQSGFFLFTICMGSSFWISNGTAFFWISMVLSAIGSFTEAIFTVMLYTDVTNRYKEESGLTISFVKLVEHCASLFGVSLGGLLVDWWAYPLPFYLYGTALVLSFPFIVKCLPKADPIDDESIPIISGGKACSTCWKLLCDPLFIADMVTLMMYWSIMGFNATTLEPSLRMLQFSHSEVGNVFALQYLCSILGSVVAGAFCHFQMEAFYGFVGQIFATLAYLILGPAPFIPYERTLWMIYLAQVFIGLAMSAMFGCAYSHALKVAKWRGYPDNVQTKGFVSSSVQASMIIGGLITPPLAGYVVQEIGYRNGTVIMFGLFAAWIPVTFALWMHTLFSPGTPGLCSTGSLSEHATVPNIRANLS